MLSQKMFIINIFTTIIMATTLIVSLQGCSDQQINDAQAAMNTIHPMIDTTLTAAPVGHITLYIMLAVDILSSVLAGLAACSKRQTAAEKEKSDGNNQTGPCDK